MKNLAFLLFALFINSLAEAQIIEKPVVLYASVQDFAAQKPIEINAIAVLKEVSSRHIQIKEIVNERHEKIKGRLSGL